MNSNTNKNNGESAFSSIDIVSQCLSDIPRTNAFRKAIFDTITQDNIVLDTGTGSGIMSLFAAKAGAKNVISIEYDPFIAKIAKKVVDTNKLQNIIDIKIGDARNYKYTSNVQFDVVIAEMLTTGMIDEHQVEAINNLYKCNVVTEETTFIPYKQETFVNVGFFDFNFYNLNLPFLRHAWKFYDSKMRTYDAFSEKTLLNSINFSKVNKIKFQNTLLTNIQKSGKINSIYISSISHLTKDITIGDTDALNGPLIIPIEEMYVKKAQKIILDISYSFG